MAALRILGKVCLEMGSCECYVLNAGQERAEEGKKANRSSELVQTRKLLRHATPGILSKY